MEQRPTRTDRARSISETQGTSETRIEEGGSTEVEFEEGSFQLKTVEKSFCRLNREHKGFRSSVACFRSPFEKIFSG